MMYRLECPPAHPLGAWSPKNYEEDYMERLLPVPRSQFVMVLMLFGATGAALTGRTDTKSLLLGASLGAIASIGLTLATGKD